MTVTEFFQYLLAHDATRQLGLELAEVHAHRTRTIRRTASSSRASAA